MNVWTILLISAGALGWLLLLWTWKGRPLALYIALTIGFMLLWLLPPKQREEFMRPKEGEDDA